MTLRPSLERVIEERQRLEGITGPPPSLKISEAAFQVAVMQYAQLNAWKVAHFHDSRRQIRPGVFVGDKAAAGFPDLVLTRETVIYAELKTERGVLSKAQREWLDRLTQAGQIVKLWRPSNWDEIVNTLKRRHDNPAAAIDAGMRDRAHTKWLATPEYPLTTRIELMLEAALKDGNA